MMSFFTLGSSKTTVKVLERCVPTIIFNTDALIKMQLFVENCADEVGWLGTAIKSKDVIYVDDVFLFDQEVHSTTTEITPQGLSDFAEALLTQPNGMETWNNIKLWGHSHVNMGVSPSGQDESQMVTFADGGHDWFIRIIANKKGDIKVDLFEYSQGITYYDVPWEEEVSEEERAIYDKIDMLEGMLRDIADGKVNMLEPLIKQEIGVKVRKKSWGTTYTKDTNDQVSSYLYKDHSTTTSTTTTTNRAAGEVGTTNPEDEIFIDMFGMHLMTEFGACLDLEEIGETMMQYGINPKKFDRSELINIFFSAQRINNDTYGYSYGYLGG